jgi:hypothetical protein
MGSSEPIVVNWKKLKRKKLKGNRKKNGKK